MKRVRWEKGGEENVGEEVIKIIMNYVGELR